MIEPSAQIGVFGHGYTYTGHPVACAAALKTLEIYERENLFFHAAQMGEYMHLQLQKFADHDLVGEIRGKGLIAAVEFVANKKTGESFTDGSVGAFAKNACQENGLLIRAVAGNSIAFCPPLIITEEQIDKMLNQFSLSLDATLEYANKEGLLSN
jgi:adenosylmethionine-8-amino-7-oxononanoate aminotransferase